MHLFAQWFSAWVMLPLGTFDDVWKFFGCHNRGGRDATGLQWLEAEDAAKHPTLHETALQQRSIQSKVSTVLRLRKAANGRYYLE